MGSVEGTYVNGKRVNKGRVSFGDEIRVGGTTIRLENPAAVAAVSLSAAVSSTDGGADAPVRGSRAARSRRPLPRGEPRQAPVRCARAPMDPSFAATEQNESCPRRPRSLGPSPRLACAPCAAARRAGRWACR